MKKNVGKNKTADRLAGKAERIRKEEEAAGVPEDDRFPQRFKVLPKNQRHEVSPDAFEPRNTKVRVSIYLDMDVLDFFKGLAKLPGAQPYQTQINAALREIVERTQAADYDPRRACGRQRDSSMQRSEKLVSRSDKMRAAYQVGRIPGGLSAPQTRPSRLSREFVLQESDSDVVK